MTEYKMSEGEELQLMRKLPRSVVNSKKQFELIKSIIEAHAAKKVAEEREGSKEDIYAAYQCGIAQLNSEMPSDLIPTVQEAKKALELKYGIELD